jgi:indole-3-glycerol phosphate synthase/phosphoribosylanthranilate isomerase
MNFLEKARRSKEKEVARAKKRLPLSRMKKGLRKSRGGFLRKLRPLRSRVRLIAELKKASPSKGVLKKDFDVAALATLYGHYADAVSVVTDSAFFKGKKEYMREAAVKSGLPVLRKDFITDEYQIYESRYYGADAVLLISELLTAAQISRFIKVASSLGMDCLVEASDSRALRKALSAKARIIGINNRNLRTLKVDFRNTERLLKLIPRAKRKGLVIVSESGVESALQMRRLQGKVNAALVGSALMEARNTETKLRELAGKPLVKICGITNRKDARMAAGFRADMLGFNFFRKSPRFISVKEAGSIIASVPKILTAGVFVNEKPETVNRIAKRLSLDFVQLHGDESPSYCRKIKGNVIKAIRVKGRESLAAIAGYDTPYILLDTYVKGVYGGTGKETGLRLKSLPANRLVFLSGGINPANVKERIRLRPFAVDVCSGVEKDRGLKDFKKMKALIKKAGGAADAF